MYCCEPFGNLIENAGQKGISIVLKSELDITFFCLQSRGVNAADCDRAKRGELKLAGINLAHQTGVQFCPFCGTKLSNWIATHKTEVQELITRSKPFLL